MNFKEIEDYPNYLIYEDGRVWTKPRKRVKGGFLKPYIDKWGYWKITLHKNSKQKHFLISRLLAIHFIPNPENKPCVDHKDGITTNNNLSNLRWVTQRENCKNMHCVKGVTYDSIEQRNKRWRAYWFEDGKYKSKRFLTEEEALNYRKLMVDKFYNRPIMT